MGRLRTWFRRWGTAWRARRGRRSAHELDGSVRRAALDVDPVVPPAAQLLTILPRVTAVTVRWEDADGNTVHRGESSVTTR